MIKSESSPTLATQTPRDTEGLLLKIFQIVNEYRCGLIPDGYEACKKILDEYLAEVKQ